VVGGRLNVSLRDKLASCCCIALSICGLLATASSASEVTRLERRGCLCLVLLAAISDDESEPADTLAARGGGLPSKANGSSSALGDDGTWLPDAIILGGLCSAGAWVGTANVLDGDRRNL
jgi:hypothetical protein